MSRKKPRVGSGTKADGGSPSASQDADENVETRLDLPVVMPELIGDEEQTHWDLPAVESPEDRVADKGSVGGGVNLEEDPTRVDEERKPQPSLPQITRTQQLSFAHVSSSKSSAGSGQESPDEGPTGLGIFTETSPISTDVAFEGSSTGDSLVGAVPDWEEDLSETDFVIESVKSELSEVVKANRRRTTKETGKPGVKGATDHWADFDEDSGWESITGHSKVRPRPDVKVAGASATDIEPAQESAVSSGHARLTGLGGADTGRTFDLDTKTLNVGREPSGEIVLQDVSVSRHHAQIFFEGGQFYVRDAESGNGTFLNGQRITQAMLHDGDQLGFGSTLFRFADVGRAFKPVDVSKAQLSTDPLALSWFKVPRIRRLVSGGIVVAVLLLVVVFGTLTLDHGDANAQGVRYYAQGIDAFRRGAWEEATENFAMVLSLVPQHENSRIYLQEMDAAKSARVSFDKARQSLAAGDWEAAVRSLKTIPPRLHGSTYMPLWFDVVDAVDRTMDSFQSAVEQGETQGLLETLDKIEAIFPDRRDAAFLRQRLEATSRDNASAIKGSPDPSKEVGSVARAQSLFAKGEIQKALEALPLATDKETARLAKDMNRFNQIYQEALRARRSQKSTEAIQSLKQASSLESEISGGKTPLAGDIRRKLAEMYYLEGFRAARSKHYSVAYQRLRQSLKYQANYDAAQRELMALEEDAKNLYLEGFTAERAGDVKTAKRRYRQVLERLPPSAKYHQNAKLRLSVLQ
ncbi:MAG: FHA domain-containing protein [Myxococcota bacterium]